MIMVAGPYGTNATPEQRTKNLAAMNEAALAVWNKGHLPVIGVNNALPLIAMAGEGTYEDLMMPLSLALAERCDAVLRIGGPSSGADREVDLIASSDGRVFTSLEDIPDA